MLRPYYADRHWDSFPGRPPAFARSQETSSFAPPRNSLAGGMVLRRLCVVLLIFLGCHGTARRPDGRTAQRIVSLLPSFTEILFAIGAGDRLVGRTTWCDYPPEARAVPSVGDGMPPSVEAVAARRPDLVVIYRSGPNVTAAEQLERLGPVARRLGGLTGHSRAADSLAHVMDSLASQPPTPSTQSLAFIVWDNPPIVIGAGSYLDRLAALAGARNVFRDVGAPSAQVSIETIAARDPDFLAVLSDSAVPPAYASRPEWRVVRAVRARRFLFLPGQLFGRPGPRAADAIRELRRRLEAAR